MEATSVRESVMKACVLIVSLLLSADASAAADITGQIRDPAGASVPKARVKVIDTHGKSVATVVTDPDGRFIANAVPAGKYLLQVETEAFAATTVEIELTETGVSAPVIITLKLKDVKQQVTVSEQPDSLTLPGATAAQEKLETLPGKVSVVQAEQYRGGALTSMDDALSLTPGVFAQPKEGSEEVRLSVRGSGMIVPFGSRGVQILRDGIPLTRADGFINPEPADASNADYIEVYRGADALEFGAASLGGAINVVSPDRPLIVRSVCSRGVRIVRLSPRPTPLRGHHG